MLSLKEAAEYLGYSEKGFRRIVDRSRAASKGAKVRGPVIRFFQTSRNAPVRFQQEWIDEFVEKNTIDPFRAMPAAKKVKSRPKRNVVVDSHDLF